MSRYICFLSEIDKKRIKTAGGKGANLGELIKIGVSVPLGFVILSSTFEKFLEKNDINVEIEARRKKIKIEDIESVEETSEIIKDLILKGETPKEIEKEILEAFEKLKARYVAVRSSATAEDSKIDSWAGQLESFLNITKKDLIQKIKECWASLYSPRALFYKEKRRYKKEIKIAVVIQKMIQSEVSGVCFTVHPITEDKNQMVIEAIFGLGEMLVQGKVSPDSYVVDKLKIKSKKSKFILDINRNFQDKMMVRGKKGNKIIEVPKEKRKKQKLSEKKIRELAKICFKIEKHYREPQDIEWALSKGKFYILQTRPITGLKKR